MCVVTDGSVKQIKSLSETVTFNEVTRQQYSCTDTCIWYLYCTWLNTASWIMATLITNSKLCLHILLYCRVSNSGHRYIFHTEVMSFNQVNMLYHRPCMQIYVTGPSIINYVSAKKSLTFLFLFYHNLQTIYIDKLKSLPPLQNLMGVLPKFMKMRYLIQS